MTSEKSNGLNATQGPGQVFIQAREALAITQAETADVLNLSVSVIRAIENNDDSALPERVYVMVTLDPTPSCWVWLQSR